MWLTGSSIAGYDVQKGVTEGKSGCCVVSHWVVFLSVAVLLPMRILHEVLQVENSFCYWESLNCGVRVLLLRYSLRALVAAAEHSAVGPEFLDAKVF